MLQRLACLANVFVANVLFVLLFHLLIEVVQLIGDGVLDVLRGGGDLVAQLLALLAGLGLVHAAPRGGAGLVGGVLDVAPGLLGGALYLLGSAFVRELLVAGGVADRFLDLAGGLVDLACYMAFIHDVLLVLPVDVLPSATQTCGA